jgi:hypothetical protein
MKTRMCFVANSSSSSFIISLDKLSASQLEKIHNHIEVAQAYDETVEYTYHDDDDDVFDTKFYAESNDRWGIELKDNNVVMTTWMDNFDMERFLVSVVEVNPDDIKWDGSY